LSAVTRTDRVTQAVRRHLREPLFSSAYSLIASTSLTAAIGVVFWAVAARIYPAAEVGRDAVLVSSLIVVSSICQLNLSGGIARFLPAIDASNRRRTLLIAYAVSGVVALAGGALFVAFAPDVAPQLEVLRADGRMAVAFVLSVVVWGVFALQDAVLTALRRAAIVPLKNTAFALAKLAALPALLALGSHDGIFLAWVAPTVILVPVISWLIRRGEQQRSRSNATPPTASALPRRRVLVRFLAQDYAGYVLAEAPLTLLPLVVLSALGGRANAFFAIPFSIITSLDLLFLGISTSMTVEGAHTPERVRELVRLVAHRFLLLFVPVVAVIVVAAPLLLTPFGPAYVAHGAAPLRLLAAASLLRALTSIYLGVARLQTSGMRILWAQGTLSVVSLALALVLVGPLGTSGVALGWLVANVLVAGAAAPTVWRLVRPGPPLGYAREHGKRARAG
jgi:O-antigen/teichoic acid export membrane protein